MKVHGLLLLDKPLGLSSNVAMQKARRLFDADKAGHGGTLDPLASGLLPVLFGEACKLAMSSLEGDKGYEAVVRFGTVTSTDDAEGEVVRERAVELAGIDERIAAILPAFRGPITQVPPVYSALKVGGKALYRHAREGRPIVPEARAVVIHALTVVDRQERDLRLAVHCSKGTYIRSLARDIGEALGCGAHLAGLRRTRVGRYSIADAVTLDVLARSASEERPEHLIGLSDLLPDWPTIELDQALAARFALGQTVPLATPPANAEAGRVAVVHAGRLIGLAELRPSTLPGRWVVAPSRVIQTPDEISR